MSELEELKQKIKWQQEAKEKLYEKLKQKSAVIYELNQEIWQLKGNLEQRIKERTRELMIARDQALKANIVKSEFLANISHEIRTPINAILNYIMLVLQEHPDILPQQASEDLTNARQAAKTLLAIINDILDFSKIEAGQAQTFMETFSLEELIHECISTAKALIKDKEVVVVYESTHLPMLKSDHTKITQILNNLLSNAAKFTQIGKITIRTYCKESEEIIYLEVEDTGCGIPQQQQSFIFETFKQADRTIQKRFGGTGLGLAITKRYCEMLDINIGVSSKANKGTTFELQIPTHPIKEVKGNITSILEQQDFSENMLDNEEATVLCFNNPETYQALEEHLVDVPLQLKLIKDVLEIHDIKFCNVWAIVLEPDEEGFGLLAKLKNNPNICHIPIIMCSIESRYSGCNLGLVECLTKPTKISQLKETIERITKGIKGRILVVEDDKAIQTFYEDVLSMYGYQAHTLGDGLQALDFILKEPPPQAILLDLLMPGLDGFRLLELIKRDNDWNKTPVVVITGKQLSKEEKKLLQQGSQMLTENNKYSVEQFSKHIKSIASSIELGSSRIVLVIDDNHMNLNVIARILEKAGYIVHQALCAKKGIEIAMEKNPDVILVDLAMPEIDGFTAIKMIKKNPEISQAVFIACSAFVTQEFKEKAFDVGFETYITKPIEPDILVKKVARSALTSKIRRRLFANKS